MNDGFDDPRGPPPIPPAALAAMHAGHGPRMPMMGMGGMPPMNPEMAQQMLQAFGGKLPSPEEFMRFMQGGGAMAGMNNRLMPPPMSVARPGPMEWEGAVNGGTRGSRAPPGPNLGKEDQGGGDHEDWEEDRGGEGGAAPDKGGMSGQAAAGGNVSSAQKRPFSDISNEQPAMAQQPTLQLGTLLENESGKIDIKEDGFYAGPYKQEKMLKFQVEAYLEKEELKEELTVGDRTSNTGMCIWLAKGTCKMAHKCPMRHSRTRRTDVCKHWLRSQCKKGDFCEYLHQYDLTRMPLCHFFAEGQCTKDDCQFLHIRPEDKVLDCPWYARGFCKHGAKCRKRHARKELCGSYMAGFCPKGPECKLGHPKWELPTEEEEKGTMVGGLAGIRCHACNEYGHKANQCPNAKVGAVPGAHKPAAEAPQNPDEKKKFTGRVTSVKDGFCFLESRPGDSNVYLPAQVADSVLINVGDVITVWAHWNPRNSNWRAIPPALRDGVAVPGREVPIPNLGSGSGLLTGLGGGGGGAFAAAGRGGGGGKPPGWVASNIKSKICKAWSIGTCAYGANCTFAHGEHELVPLHSK